MKFKRLAAALLSAAMVVSLAACSNNKESAESGSGTTGTEAVHVNLAESWGFEYFYTILTPEVSSSQYDITYYLTSFYDTLVTYNENNELLAGDNTKRIGKAKFPQSIIVRLRQPKFYCIIPGGFGTFNDCRKASIPSVILAEIYRHSHQ